MNINSIDSSGSTPLHWACHSGSELSLNFLLSFGAEVNAKDDVGLTPLHLGAISEKHRIIKKLIQYGADKKIRDIKGRSPYDLAKERNKYTVLELLLERNSSISNYLCLEQQIRKSDQNKSNIIFFVLIHIIFEAIVYCVILPGNYFNYNLYIN